MAKRLLAILLTIVLLLSIQNCGYACDEGQSNTYVTQIIFGDGASSRESDPKVKMLLYALYLCCEQSDGRGQDKLTYLKGQRVTGVPTLSKIDIKGENLLECSHNTWEYEYVADKKVQNNRRKILQNTVNKVFDFGLFNNLFGSGSGKCNSFAAMLYYSHILCDYLADDPSETGVTLKGREVAPYSGARYITLNGGIPGFSAAQKKTTESCIYPGDLDEYGRCGVVYAVIGRDSMEFVGPRPNLPNPTGWKQNQYTDIVNGNDLYNRCHLIGRQFCGVDNLHNLITGTRYLNDTMGLFEDEVAEYIKRTENHVLYRVTPVYKGDNKLASGVQMEGYSVEDSGKGICFNVYCYNVQPGVDLNYANGDNSLADTITGANETIPFAKNNAGDSNPDLIFEMNKHLEVLFADQKKSSTYISMMNEIKTIASEARAVGNRGENYVQCYVAMKEYEYKYFEILKSYVPLLLEKESFFTSAFK